MAGNLVATEEVRDALYDRPMTAQELAADLVVSESTIRRHLAELFSRNQVTADVAPQRPARWKLTPEGAAASRSNESL